MKQEKQKSSEDATEKLQAEKQELENKLKEYVSFNKHIFLNLEESVSRMYKILLPPANKVWGKVMFSEASVILSTGGLRMMSLPCLAAWSHVPSKGSQPLVPCSFVLFRGSVTRGSLSREGTVGSPPPPRNEKNGRYTSYWNAFLLHLMIFFRQSLRFFGWLVG